MARQISFFLIFWLHHVACEILLPNQGLNLCPLHWNLRALTTGLPRNSEVDFFKGLNSPHNETNSVDESNRRLDIAEEKIREAGTRAEDRILIAVQQVKEMKYGRGVERCERLVGVSGEEIEMFKMIMASNFPILIKNVDSQTQEVQ